MASASHTCTLPMTLSAPDGPQNLSVMSTMESGIGVTQGTQRVCMLAPLCDTRMQHSPPMTARMRVSTYGLMMCSLTRFGGMSVVYVYVNSHA